jgi:hypothetical protein
VRDAAGFGHRSLHLRPGVRALRAAHGGRAGRARVEIGIVPEAAAHEIVRKAHVKYLDLRRRDGRGWPARAILYWATPLTWASPSGWSLSNPMSPTRWSDSIRSGLD